MLYDLLVMTGFQLVQVVHLPLQHGQGLSERLQICEMNPSVSAGPNLYMRNRCYAILRSFRFIFRISVSRMILLFSRRVRSYDDDRSCWELFRFKGRDRRQRMDHPRARWCGRSPGVDVAVSRIAYLAFQTGKK